MNRGRLKKNMTERIYGVWLFFLFFKIFCHHFFPSFYIFYGLLIFFILTIGSFHRRESHLSVFSLMGEWGCQRDIRRRELFNNYKIFIEIPCSTHYTDTNAENFQLSTLRFKQFIWSPNCGIKLLIDLFILLCYI